VSGSVHAHGDRAEIDNGGMLAHGCTPQVQEMIGFEFPDGARRLETTPHHMLGTPSRTETFRQNSCQKAFVLRLYNQSFATDILRWMGHGRVYDDGVSSS
jgi:hypothetical protein